MLVDVNIPYSGKPADRDQLEATVVAAFQNGWRGVALNRTVTRRPKNAQDAAIETLDLAQLAEKYRAAERYGPLDALRDGQFVQLRRVTFELENATQQAMIQSEGLCGQFDVVAVQPLNEKMFQQACVSLNVDLIQLDFSQRPSFLFKHTLVNTAVQRGVQFELCYSASLRSDASKRHFMRQAADLVRVTHGKHVVLSSGARSALEIRAPADAANLLCVLGVNHGVARCAVVDAVRALVVRARSRKDIHKQVISSVPVSEVGPSQSWQLGDFVALRSDSDGDS